jgi:hypothetical protein
LKLYNRYITKKGQSYVSEILTKRFAVQADKVPFCQGNNCRINRKFTIYAQNLLQKQKRPIRYFIKSGVRIWFAIYSPLIRNSLTYERNPRFIQTVDFSVFIIVLANKNSNTFTSLKDKCQVFFEWIKKGESLRIR